MLMLLQVDKQNGNRVSGVHIQWVSEGFQRAVELAKGTEQVNGYRFFVAVVEALYDSYATGRYYQDLERLDVTRKMEGDKNEDQTLSNRT